MEKNTEKTRGERIRTEGTAWTELLREKNEAMEQTN